MAESVDHELLLQYVQRELGGADRARVRRLVAEDPAWREALDQALALELALSAVADREPLYVASGEAPEPTSALWPRWWAGAPVMVLAAATAWWAVMPPAVTLTASPRIARTGECAVTPDGVMLGDEGPAEVVCAGDVVEFEVRPDREAAWTAPEVRLDGAPIRCPSAAVGEEGVGRVSCTVGVDFRLQDGERHVLSVVVEGREIARTAVRSSISPGE